MMMSRTLPEQTAAVGNFLRTLRGMERGKMRGGFVSLPASISLMSAGSSATANRSRMIFSNGSRRKIAKLVERLAALDAPGFFNEIAKDEDKRKICGFSPLYSLIHLLDGARGNHLHYGQAFTPETGFGSDVYQHDL